MTEDDKYAGFKLAFGTITAFEAFCKEHSSKREKTLPERLQEEVEKLKESYDRRDGGGYLGPLLDAKPISYKRLFGHALGPREDIALRATQAIEEVIESSRGNGQRISLPPPIPLRSGMRRGLANWLFVTTV